MPAVFKLDSDKYCDMTSKDFIEEQKVIRTNTYDEKRKTNGIVNTDEFREYLMNRIISYKPYVYNDIATRVKTFPQCGTYTVAYNWDINIKYAYELSQFMKNEENINNLIKSLCSKDEYKGFNIRIKDITDWSRVLDISSTFLYLSAELKISVLFEVDLRT